MDLYARSPPLGICALARGKHPPRRGEMNQRRNDESFYREALHHLTRIRPNYWAFKDAFIASITITTALRKREAGEHPGHGVDFMRVHSPCNPKLLDQLRERRLNRGVKVTSLEPAHA